MMQRQHVRKLRRRVGVPAVVLAAALTLSGCFVIPLVDGRSPFDDPFGASTSDISRALPAVQTALADTVLSETAWDVDAQPASENCEGACNLHIAIRIAPGAETSELFVPDSVLRQVLVAAIPVAEAHRVNLSVRSGRSEVGAPADLNRAAEQLFGRVPDRGIRAESFSLTRDGDDVEIFALTRGHSGVLGAMGLSE